MSKFFTYTFDIRIVSKIFISIIVLICLMVLIGWQFDINSMKKVLPFLVAMNPLTAVCFLFIVLSFQLIIAESKIDQQYSISKVFNSIVFIACCTKLICLYYNLNFKIDAILFNDKIDSDSHIRLNDSMSVNTALGFIFLVVSLWLYHYKTERRWVPSQILAILVFYLGVFSLLCYSYNAPEFYDFSNIFQCLCFLQFLLY